MSPQAAAFSTMGSIYNDDDDDVSSLAPSIRSNYSLQSDMPETSQLNHSGDPPQTKAQEASREASSSRPHRQQPLSHEPDDIHTQQQETTPLLHSGPPPTYSDAIAAGARSGDARDVWRRAIGHGTLDMNAFSQLQQSPTGAENQNPSLHEAALSYQRPPESMRGTAEDHSGSSESEADQDDRLLEERRSRRRSHHHHARHKKLSKKLRRALKGGLGVAFVVAFVVMLVTLIKLKSHDVSSAVLRTSLNMMTKFVAEPSPLPTRRRYSRNTSCPDFQAVPYITCSGYRSTFPSRTFRRSRRILL